MKIILIILNLLMLLGVVHQGYRLFHAGKEEVTVVKRDRQSRPAAAKTVQPPAPLDFASALNVIRDRNVFDFGRCPEAMGGGGGSTTVLLGIYRIGGQLGCIVEQRQKGNRQWGKPRRANERGPNRNNTTRPYKSFLKLGDALENGYTLSEVYDDRVVLTRGGGRLELKLERASLNTAQARAARARAQAQRNRAPSAQQVQQNMMNQQMRMMGELLRMNRDQMSRGGSRGGSARGRR